LLNLGDLRFCGIKMLILDLDGTIVENLFFRLFGQNIGFPPRVIKPFFFRTAELLEKRFARYKLNPAITQIINDLNGLTVGIITDRSAIGLKNVLRVLPKQLIDRVKFIQVRDHFKRINKAGLNLGPGTEFWSSNKIKPHPQVLTNLICFVKQNNLERKHVLIVDDNLYFRKAAKYLGFKTYPDPDDDSEYSNPYSCAYLST
jgi:FMN phosphatase YigB (HAD superfamily)